MELSDRSTRKKVGIMGGTFDPIHIAHLILAQQACVQFDLDEVLFMPSSQPPHKDNRQVSSVEHRQAMVELAIDGNDKFVYSDLEIRRVGTTYTSDTLKELCVSHPDTIFYFIMGADSLFAVGSWHKPEEIFQKAILLVGNRMDMPEDKLKRQIQYLEGHFGGQIYPIDMPDIAISSHEVRNRRASGLPIRYYVPESVYQYIMEKQLYQ
ncbi:nicotinate-nucleotide adenylyltransferase [Qiania dongpingensis]|uniref:Probable nicotinate-nucleotide adenylyltransferase n=1 Tax=Qiania dongpingensis TaxID=2763669 RepID=A0A7G9G4R1_9FIRM|nr:nicotinate-nucleotide adenylyltransferase [Qiania dongpingensis]QNM05793.1 nicotinate-nucleotide adenylyltransferase [Qiania dongpingensis]